MACSTGALHTVCIADDGEVHSFGYNGSGQLGLGHNRKVFTPTPILNLPKMKYVSCGAEFTVCLDEEGSVWTFGKNEFGQLGTGGFKNSNVPVQIPNIPPIHSVACGNYHTLLIDTDTYLWSFGNNQCGQLCYGDLDYKLKVSPQKTSFSDILNVSAGYNFTLFQNFQGEIFGCGFNEKGQLGFKSYFRVVEPTRISDQSNFVQFCCGEAHSLFLDGDGNVFSSGCNEDGSLGVIPFDSFALNHIQNIPPIQYISCAGKSSFLIDYDGNLWSFGKNNFYQLGCSDGISRKVPTKINSLQNIVQVSYGSGNSVLCQDDQKNVFVMGNSNMGQLGLAKSNDTPVKLDNFFWGEPKVFKRTAKSARK